jgi:hypothetical protein
MWTPRLLCENSTKRKSIAQRSRRPQRGDFAVGGQNSLGNTVASRARISSRGRHRTEVTEGIAVDGQNFIGNTVACRARISLQFFVPFYAVICISTYFPHPSSSQQGFVRCA